MRSFLAALALLAAAPGMAQSAPSAPGAFPAEVLVPNEEARATFELLETNPPSGDPLAGLPAEEAGPIDAVIRQMALPGEQVTGWPDVGVDLDAIVAARAGGASAAMTSAANPYGVQRTYFADRPIESIVPAGWVLIGRRGDAFEGGSVNIEIGNISPKLIMVMRVDYGRRGRMRCQRRTETRVYSNPNVAATEADSIAYVMTLRLGALIDGMNICFGTEEREPGVYVTRPFDSTGRRLPALDAAQPSFRIASVEPFPPPSTQP
jgi:hypothetical protein